MHISVTIQKSLFCAPKQVQSHSVVYFQKILAKRERKAMEIILNRNNSLKKNKKPKQNQKAKVLMETIKARNG